MANANPIARQRLVAALLIALVADGLQLFFNSPIALIFGMGAEVADIAIDVITAVAVIGLLGYSPLLLPTFVIEAVPFVDGLPTWTACVVYLIWKKDRQRKALPH